MYRVCTMSVGKGLFVIFSLCYFSYCLGERKEEIPINECIDESPRCIKLAASGDCRTNPAYMSMHCSRSCGFCEKGPYKQRDVNTPKRTFTKILMWSFVVVSLILTFKTYFGGKYNSSSVRLHGKTVVITGANTGIGKETALELARRGAKIIIGCRDEKKSLDTMKEISKQTGNGDLEFIRLDLESFRSIRKFAQIINKHVERIDILINNAGSIANRYTRTEDGHEKILQVNYLGHFLLTELLMDKLKASAPSRIINVSSDAHLWCKINTFREPMMESTFGSWLAYCQSKMAQIMSTREASKRLEGTGVSVFAVHPGTVRTEIGRDLPVLKYKIVSLLLVPLAYIFMKSAYQGAQTTIYCAVERNLQQYSGEYFKECTHCDCNKKALDEDACKDLYKLSQN